MAETVAASGAVKHLMVTWTMIWDKLSGAGMAALMHVIGTIKLLDGSTEMVYGGQEEEEDAHGDNNEAV